MPIDLTACDNASRLLIEAELRVAPGTGGRFQPTGFPDLGPALYKGIHHDKGKPQTVNMLLVESVQSIANRLEEVCLQGEGYEPNCQGIPYVRVLDGNRGNVFLTSSVREPHRLGSPYILGTKNNWTNYKIEFGRSLASNKNKPVHIWTMVPEIFNRDPGCVLHGVFLDDIDGRIRLPRLVSGCVEAMDPMTANSGGVYRGEVTASDNIPYSRQEFTSPTIKAMLVIHLGTLRGHNLDEPKRRFLVLWALYKIDRFLTGYLHLRTACEFEVASISTSLDGTAWKWNSEPDPDIGTWPGRDEIRLAFDAARDACFPRVDSEGQPIVRVVDVVFKEEVIVEVTLPDGVDGASFNLAGFEGRVRVRPAEPAKGKKKASPTAIVAEGEIAEGEDALLNQQNPPTQLIDDQEQDNPNHKHVNDLIKKWKKKQEEVRKKAGTDGESEEQ